MTNIEGTVAIKLDEFLKVLERANLFDRIVESGKMYDSFTGGGNPILYFDAERVIKDEAPEVFADITRRRRAEWEQKKKEMEESA